MVAHALKTLRARRRRDHLPLDTAHKLVATNARQVDGQRLVEIGASERVRDSCVGVVVCIPKGHSRSRHPGRDRGRCPDCKVRNGRKARHSRHARRAHGSQESRRTARDQALEHPVVARKSDFECDYRPGFVDIVGCPAGVSDRDTTRRVDIAYDFARCLCPCKYHMREFEKRATAKANSTQMTEK